MMINKWFTIKDTKETFVDFNKDNAENSLTTLYIPQYSTDSNKLVVHLYDNLYFDDKNGAVIEVEGTQNSVSVSDTTGSSISNIHIYPRNGGLTTQTYAATKKTDGTVQAADTVESKTTTLTPAYDQFTTICKVLIQNTSPAVSNMYQYFYYTWNKQTFIHLFKYNIADSRTKQLIYLRSFVFGETGLKIVVNDESKITSAIPIPSENGTSKASYENENNKKLVSSPAPPQTTPTTPLTKENSYLDNSIQVIQITPYVFYDNARGIIIINTPLLGTPPLVPKLTYFDNAGNTVTTPILASKYTTIADGTYKIFAKTSPSGMVLVTSYTYNTIISVIAYTGDKTNKIVSTQRFNNKEKTLVNDLASDPDYVSATSPPPTTAPATTPPGGWEEWNKKFNEKWNDYNGVDSKMNCGSDKNCWYWFFKSLPSFKDSKDMLDMSDIYGNNGVSTISDDYFLKSEVVPPVCPQCPNCPGSGCGTCTSCGGNGGSGTSINSVSLNLTPITTNTFKDNLGNVYIATTDTSGNTRYILQGTGTSSNTGTSSATGTTSGTSANTGTNAASLDNNISGVANNVINTAGGVVGTAGNLAYSAGSGAVNLLKDTGSGAVDLLKDVGSGIANLGSGGLQTQQGSQYNSTTGVGIGAGASLASTSDKTFGKMQGQTPVDNYSYYGALQSKGGNFMPVTADFSSFRK